MSSEDELFKALTRISFSEMEKILSDRKNYPSNTVDEILRMHKWSWNDYLDALSKLGRRI